MSIRQLVYRSYERRLAASLSRAAVPRHVGVILDGNRRWARAAGARTSEGHRVGADRILDFLGWCEDAGVERVTLWLLSTDNLTRPQTELADLLGIIEDVVGRLAAAGRWRVHPVGALDLLPAAAAHRLKEDEGGARGGGGPPGHVAVGLRRPRGDAGAGPPPPPGGAPPRA